MDLSSARAARYGRAARRWARLLASGKAKPGLRVFYGHDLVPAPGERAAGGTAKAQKLAARFPNSPSDFSLLYLGTTWLPRDLGALLKGRLCHVNVIPFNPVDVLEFERPDPANIERFAETLRATGIPTTVRYSRGVEIAAACGQLRAKHQRATA